MHDFIHEWFHHILPMIPVLFISFYLIEKIDKNNLFDKIFTNHLFALLLISLLCMIPSCSIPLILVSLFAKHKITFGTLVSGFIASNDESMMLLVTTNHVTQTLLFIIIKFVFAIITGLLIDYFYQPTHFTCDKEIKHCCCKHHSTLQAVCKHTLQILCILTITMLMTTLLFQFIDISSLSLALSNTFFGQIIFALLGFIPGCSMPVIAFSLLHTQLISFSTYVSLLTTCNGFGLVVLLKNQYNKKSIFLLISSMIINALLISIFF